MIFFIVFVVIPFFTFGGFTIGRMWELNRRPRHKHAWVVVEQKMLPSALEIAKDAGLVVKKATGEPLSSLTRQRVLVHYRCNLCSEERVERV